MTGALKIIAVLKASVPINAVLNRNTWTNNAVKENTHRDSVDRASDMAMATDGTIIVLGDNSEGRASDMINEMEDVDIITVAITVVADTVASGMVEADETLVRKVVVPIIAALGLGIAINEGRTKVFLMLVAPKAPLLTSR